MTTNRDRQTDYWDSVAREKTFTHPLNWAWLEGRLPEDARVLDVGCGYGRVCGEFRRRGFRNVVGVDISNAMLKRARGEVPGVEFVKLDGDEWPLADESFDLVLLIAVLTCIPTDRGQRRLIQEIRRVLRPGGLVFASVYPLQDDTRNRERYDRWAATHQPHGVFELDAGAVLRHHSPQWLTEVFEDFSILEQADLSVSTMNGHASRIVQMLLER